MFGSRFMFVNVRLHTLYESIRFLINTFAAIKGSQFVFFYNLDHDLALEVASCTSRQIQGISLVRGYQENL